MRPLEYLSCRLALDDNYKPDSDVRLLLREKFKEIKRIHPLRGYIPETWPTTDAIERLVKNASGQFIYAATVIRYVTSISHRPPDRLNAVLGLGHKSHSFDHPFAELDALYTNILSESILERDIPLILRILALHIIADAPWAYRLANYVEEMECFLSLEPGDVQAHLGNLASLISIEDNPLRLRLLHASLRDFLLDKRRSGKFYIDVGAMHANIARCCLHHLGRRRQPSSPMVDGYDTYASRSFEYHRDKADLTPELCADIKNLDFRSICQSLMYLPEHTAVFTALTILSILSNIEQWGLSSERVQTGKTIWKAQCDEAIRSGMMVLHDNRYRGLDTLFTFIVVRQTYRNTIKFGWPRINLSLGGRLNSRPDLEAFIGGGEYNQHLTKVFCQFLKDPARAPCQLSVNPDMYARVALAHISPMHPVSWPEIAIKSCNDIFQDMDTSILSRHLETCPWEQIFERNDLIYLGYLLREAAWSEQLAHTLILFALYALKLFKGRTDNVARNNILDYLTRNAIAPREKSDDMKSTACQNNCAKHLRTNVPIIGG
ncbi:hypothetical protein B0H34DRAFT_702327 [Crassisporium funariophilum]|nr:hypothetical protein B0H34DRAFT_702327 [Crassisporium funariophilum]